MSIPSFSVKQPVLVNLIVLLIIVSGIFAYRSMPKERIPNITIELAIIRTTMAGASPKEIEQLITIPIEKMIANVDEVEEINSTSSNGISTITVEFDQNIDNLFEKVTEVRNQIDLVSDLPEDADDPIVREAKVSFEMIRVCLVGEAPEAEIKAVAEDLEDALRIIDGVEDVVVDGVREREIWVEVDPYRLHSYGISLSEIAGVLHGRNLNLPGGLLRVARNEYVLRNKAEYRSIGEMGDTVLRGSDEEGYILLSDVAKITDTYEERKTMTRLDGEPGIILTLKKSKQSNALDLVKEVREEVAKFESRLPAGVHLRYIDDTSIEVRDRLQGLYWNFLVGLGLVITSLTLFVGWRASLMVAFGLPVAFLATFVLMNSLGMSVNMISLFGLVLVLGLIVDDSIVVCENAFRHVEQGLSLREAAVKATDEITWPVIATVLTTVAAFLPMLMMSGPLGKFMAQIPVVVSMALLASLFECLFVLPAHILEFGGAGKSGPRHEQRPWVTAVTGSYKRAIKVLLRGRYPVVAGVIVAAFGAIYLARGHMDFILFGGRDLESFTISVEAPPGASLSETTRMLDELEAAALKIRLQTPEIDTMRLRAGRVNLDRLRGDSAASNLGEINFKLVPLQDRDRFGQFYREQFRGLLDEVAGARKLRLIDANDGPPVGKPVMVRIRGENFDTMQAISKEIAQYLATIEGVTDITDDFPPGKDEIRPLLSEKRLAAIGLDMRAASMEIRGAFDGIEATSIHDGDEDIDVILKYDEAYRQSLSDVSQMVFATPVGLVPFSNIGEIERGAGFSTIQRYNQKRSIKVLAEVIEGVTTSKTVNENLIAHFADLSDRYPGFSLDFGGEFEDTNESLSSLARAFVITMILIYVILGGLFQSFVQPFIVMFAVPFSFIGVVLGFYLLDEPLGMMAIIGIIALAGIVVNGALILIEFINANRKNGFDRIESITEAGSVRFRPIVLTAITTILGLSPMSLGMFGVDPILKPMAMAIVWGLSFATVLTLVIIPCVYAIFDDVFVHVLRRPPLGLTKEEYSRLKSERQREDNEFFHQDGQESDDAKGNGLPAAARSHPGGSYASVSGTDPIH